MPRGRPKKSLKERKSKPVGLRFPPQLLLRLQGAAKASGRSLQNEIEERLLSSFSAENCTVDAFLKTAGLALAEVDDFAGQSWIANPYTFELAKAVWRKFFAVFPRPRGEVMVPDTILPVRAFDASSGSVAAAKARADMIARISKEKPDVFADGIIRNMLVRLRDAEAGGRRPQLKELRDVVDQLNPKIFGNEQSSDSGEQE